MTKKLFRNAVLFFTFVIGGTFLNSCSDFNLGINDESTGVKIADVSFAICTDDSNTDARTVLPNSDEHDLTKYLYLYNYTLSYVDEDNKNSEVIICNDFSFDKFREESNVRLATGKDYKFTLKAKDGDVIRMEGSTTITLKDKPSQTVTIVLKPAGEEYGQKLRVDWIVPDDGIITTMKAGISPERGYAESQTDEEIRELLNKALNKNRTPEELSELVEKFKFHEYVFSVINNPFEDEDPHKSEYGETVKRIGVTYDDVKTGVPRWLDYKFYDSNGVLVYESSESVYMIGGKTSSTVIYITPDHYYRRPVSIPVYNKDDTRWEHIEDLTIKLVDEYGNEYVLTPGLDELGKPVFEGLLPGASSGDGQAQATDGIFDIYVALGDRSYVNTGAEYNANTGDITGNNNPDGVKLITVDVPQEGVRLTPVDGVIGVNGTPGDEAGNGSLIIPAGQEFKVHVNLETGYGAGDDNKITIGGKEISDDETVTLNADDVSGGISVTGFELIDYKIQYLSNGSSITWKTDYEPTKTFNIKSAELPLPVEADFKDEDDDYNIGGWWFDTTGTGTVEGNLDNIIHKINAEKLVKEKLIQSAVNNTVVLNVYWIPVDYVEYRIEYLFEKLGSKNVYVEDVSVVDGDGNKVLPFHNVAVEMGESKTVDIPQVPGFTIVANRENGVDDTSATITLSGAVTNETKQILYKRNDVNITLKGNGGKWTIAGEQKEEIILDGQFGETHEHIDDPVLKNYRFCGWYKEEDLTQTLIEHVDDHKFPAKSVVYVAKWEKTMADYTVKFYYEKEDLTGYEETSQTATGAIGSFPAFNTTPKDVGFTYNDKKRSIKANGKDVNYVDKDGNTVVELYFDRKTVTFTLKANTGKFTDGTGNTTEEIILEGKYGTQLPSVDSRGFAVGVPLSPVLEGIDDGSITDDDFTFDGWHVKTGAPLEAKLPEKFPAENAIYAARWNQINGVYKVVHWAESMDKYENGDYKLLAPKAIDGFRGQMLEGSVTKKGKIGSAMVYYTDPVKGFKAPTVEIRNSRETITEKPDAGYITADAKTEVIVTYLREDYTINFHMNAGGDENASWYGDDAGAGSAETVTREGKYRTDFTPPENPVREHFIFRGWTTTPGGTLADRVDVVPSFTEEAPKDYYAVWYSKASGGLETDTSDITLTYTVTGTKIDANVGGNILTAGHWSFSWSVNNVLQSETGKDLTLTDCLNKDYEITVVAKNTDNGKIYTKTEIVTVTVK